MLSDRITMFVGNLFRKHWSTQLMRKVWPSVNYAENFSIVSLFTSALAATFMVAPIDPMLAITQKRIEFGRWRVEMSAVS